MTETWLLERAWLGDPGGAVAEGVLVEVEDGRFASVEEGVRELPRDGHRLAGLTVPGMANCHSHAFHRALRGRTQRERGTFWTWREQMYDAAARLDPDLYYDLARATYREMLATGFTSVGEFHYLHHGPGGQRYDNPNVMGLALVEAARDVGIRIALLDTCYVAAGIGRPPEGVQARFSDGDANAWASRLERFEYVEDDEVVLGTAVHSVRAVPRAQIGVVAAYGATPTEVLDVAGALGPRTTVVHATHLTGRDVAALGGASAYACFCPTTERDLGDGTGPSLRLRDAGARLTLGTDSHAVVDAFEEMRAVELDERLAARSRGHWTSAELLVAATADGHASLGFPDAGRIEVGARADLVTLDVASPRTAGTGATVETAVFAAGAADVVHVVAGGRVVATRGQHREIGRELETAVTDLWGRP